MKSSQCWVYSAYRRSSLEFFVLAENVVTGKIALVQWIEGQRARIIRSDATFPDLRRMYPFDWDCLPGQMRAEVRGLMSDNSEALEEVLKQVKESEARLPFGNR